MFLFFFFLPPVLFVSHISLLLNMSILGTAVSEAHADGKSPKCLHMHSSCVPSDGVDGSLSAGALPPGGPVCGLPACAAGRSCPLLGPQSFAGAPDTRRGGCLVSGLQHPCGQVWR